MDTGAMAFGGAKEGKPSFFAKKDQKTFVSSLIGWLGAVSTGDFVGTASKIKVFWSFFAKMDGLPCRVCRCDSPGVDTDAR
jgi:hypothetical protein